MHPKTASALAALTLTASCVNQVPLALPDTSGARAMIVLVETEVGRAAFAVDLDRGPPAVPLALDRGVASTMEVLLYDRTLAELRVAAGALVLAQATECGRPLPVPASRFVRQLSLESTSPWSAAPLEVVAEVRVRPSVGACPTLDASGPRSIDVRCSETACRATFTQTGCKVVLDTAECPFGALAGEVGTAGELCFERSEALGQCDDAIEGEGELRVVRCADGVTVPACELEVHAPAASPFAVERARVFAVAPLVRTGFERPPEGWLADLAIFGDQIAVAGWDGELNNWMCKEEVPGRLVILGDDLQVATSTRAPPCLTQLAPDPTTDGFLGVYGGSRATLGRFDRLGRRTAALPWSRAGQELDVRPSSLLVVDGTPPLALVTMTTLLTSDQPRRSWIEVVDLERFVELRSVATGTVTREGCAPFTEGRVLVLDDEHEGILVFDPRAPLTQLGPSILGRVAPSLENIGQPAWHGPSSRFLLSATGRGGGLFTFKPDPSYKLEGRARAFERFAEAWAMAPWPGEEGLVVLGLTDLDGDRAASVALADPRTARILPGHVVVGAGPIGRLHRDGRDRLVAVLPWTGEIVRLSRREAP